MVTEWSRSGRGGDKQPHPDPPLKGGGKGWVMGGAVERLYI